MIVLPKEINSPAPRLALATLGAAIAIRADLSLASIPADPLQ